MDDFIKRLTSWKTTIIGIVVSVLSILVFFGLIEPEGQAVATEAVSNFWDGMLQVLAAISGIVLIFSKD